MIAKKIPVRETEKYYNIPYYPDGTLHSSGGPKLRTHSARERTDVRSDDRRRRVTTHRTRRLTNGPTRARCCWCLVACTVVSCARYGLFGWRACGHVARRCGLFALCGIRYRRPADSHTTIRQLPPLARAIALLSGLSGVHHNRIVLYISNVRRHH